MKTVEELKEFFQCNLGGFLYDLEGRRKKIMKQFISLAVTVFVVFIIGILVVSAMKLPHAAMIAVAVISILIGVGWYFIFIKMEQRAFVYEFKRKIIKAIVEFIDQNLEYCPKKSISQGHFMLSTIFKKQPDRFRGEDYVHGRIGETNIEFSEIHAEYVTETRDRHGRTSKHWHTIFKGIFFIADFNKNFNGTTVVLPDLAEKMFGFLGKTLQKWNLTRGELIKLEDPEFEKEFVVYGDDQIEARYILTTSLMERVMHFQRKIAKETGKQIYLAFSGNKIFIAIAYDKNLFEPKLFSSNNDFNLIKEYFTDMQLAAGITEELKLNRRINS